MTAQADRQPTAVFGGDDDRDGGADGNGLSYARFGAWYDGYRQDVLEPALQAGLAALQAAISDELSDRELSRIRNTSGRVKSKRRTWRKIRQSQYATTIRTIEDIPVHIQDLVGLRITCTNLRDIETVQSALDSLPDRPDGSGRLWVDREAERDYVREPKESGYRGWHVPLGISVRTGTGSVLVICELQVRTLLQDSWGELTHEDTYSKDGELPPLVEVLSKRIADLFATLDDIAEDLRTELDRIDEEAVSDVGDTSSAPDPLTGSGQAADAASMLLHRWQRLERPMDLASLAWAIQREFGAEVSDDWFGYRSFKRFLTAALPNGEISTGDQAYLLPENYRRRDEGGAAGQGSSRRSEDRGRTADSGDAGSDPVAGMPEEAGQLRAIDRGFPMLDTEGWLSIYDGLAEAWRRFGVVETSPRVLNRLTRSARDRAEAAGSALSRRHLDYVAKAVVSGPAAEPLSSEEIAARFAALTVQRMVDFRIIAADDRSTGARLTSWLGAGTG